MRHGRAGLRRGIRTALAVSLAALALTPTAAVGVDPDPAAGGAASACTVPHPPRVLAQPDGVAAEIPVVTQETSIRWTRATRSVTYGQGGLLEGQVVTGDGAVPNADVDLYARPHGARKWTFVSSTRSDEGSGVFTFDCLQPATSTRYRVVHEANGLHGRSAAERRIAVRRHLLDELRQVGPTAFVLRGRVSPRYDGRVHLQRRDCAGCSWTTVQRTRSASGTAWRFSLDASGRRDEVWFRAMVPPGDGFARSYGDHVWSIRSR